MAYLTQESMHLNSQKVKTLNSVPAFELDAFPVPIPFRLRTGERSNPPSLTPSLHLWKALTVNVG